MAFGSASKTNNNSEGNNEGMKSASDQNQLLIESFGSKKKQKVMSSRSANKVNIHSVVGGSGNVMMTSITKQEGISIENKKGMVMEGGSGKDGEKKLVS